MEEITFKNDIDLEDVGEFDETIEEIIEYIEKGDSPC